MLLELIMATGTRQKDDIKRLEEGNEWHLAALGIQAGEAGNPGLGQAQLCGLAQQHRLQVYVQHPHRRWCQRLHP